MTEITDNTVQTTAKTLPAKRPLRKIRVGKVVSDKMHKTLVVKIVTRVPHPAFGKIVKQVKRLYVHDEKNEAKLGDRVSIMETRPLSKLKRWRLVAVLKH
ncbi:MAG: 30S ribosomal protein S17 [Verrucomicrobia bacterium]|nr:MAG: 30S ribosomal protein S17 [Verrucomicrobiota bacterium]